MDRALPLDLVKRSPAEQDGAIVTEEVMLDAGAGGEGTRAAGRRVEDRGRAVAATVSQVVQKTAAPRRELVDWIDQWISR